MASCKDSKTTVFQIAESLVWPEKTGLNDAGSGPSAGKGSDKEQREELR